MLERTYPDPHMAQREANYARARREGAYRERSVIELVVFTPGRCADAESLLTPNWCLRGSVDGGGAGDCFELTVGPPDEPEPVFRVVAPADIMEKTEEALAEATRQRSNRIEWTRDPEDVHNRGLNPGAWSWLTEPYPTLEFPLPNEWCLRISVECRGDGDRAVLTVGPICGAHCAFVIVFPADSLEQVEGLVRKMRHERQTYLEPFCSLVEESL